MAAVDYFLKLDGIKGESTDDKHRDEIDVLSFSWGATQTGTMAHGGGAGAGKVSMQDFTFTMKVNKASPTLMLACASAQHIKSATVVGRSTSGPVVEIASSALASAQENSQDFLKLSFSDILVSSYQEGGSGTDIFDNAALRYASVKYEGVPGARVAVAPESLGMLAFDPKTGQIDVIELQSGALMSGPGDERGGGGFTRGVAEYSLKDIAGVLIGGLGTLTLTVREVRQPSDSTGGAPPEEGDEFRRTPPGPAKKIGRHDLYYYAADLELTTEDFSRRGRRLGSIQVDADADPAESSFDCSELVQWATSQGSHNIGIRIQSAMDHSAPAEEEDEAPADPEDGPPFVLSPALFTLDLTLEMR